MTKRGLAAVDSPLPPPSFSGYECVWDGDMNPKRSPYSNNHNHVEKKKSATKNKQTIISTLVRMALYTTWRTGSNKHAIDDAVSQVNFIKIHLIDAVSTCF